jgi:hypothetical protein
VEWFRECGMQVDTPARGHGQTGRVAAAR